MRFEVSALIPAAAEAIYEAWLDGEGHARMTGAAATGEAEVGARFTAWGGYITGSNLALEPGRRIVQAWRTVDFAADEGDSRVEVRLEPVEGGTRVVIEHSDLPAHGEQYRQGWEVHYFAPMRAWAGRGRGG